MSRTKDRDGRAAGGGVFLFDRDIPVTHFDGQASAGFVDLQIAVVPPYYGFSPDDIPQTDITIFDTALDLGRRPAFPFFSILGKISKRT